MAQWNESQSCPECDSGDTMKTILTPPAVNFSGDGWSTKNGRIANQMRAKNKKLAAKEREQKGDGMIPSLAPNVEGQQTDSWSDAKKLAKDKGKDTSGYDRYIRKEKSG